MKDEKNNLIIITLFTVSHFCTDTCPESVNNNTGA